MPQGPAENGLTALEHFHVTLAAHKFPVALVRALLSLAHQERSSDRFGRLQEYRVMYD